MDSDKENETFDSIIMYDEVESDDDEHDSTEKRKRSSKTTPLQYQKLCMFMQENPDFTKGKADANQLLVWEELCVELNALGPPNRSNIGWRRVWTYFKANQKRKTPTAIVNDDQPFQRSETIEGTGTLRFI